MTMLQKIIKYFALALAAFLIFSIISGILGGLYFFTGVLGLQKHHSETIKNEMSAVSFEESNINSLDIDVAFTNLIIKSGESLKIETNNENINYQQNDLNLQVKEKAHNWFFKNNKGDLIVYIPDGLEFEKVKINAGAGKIQIENINTKKLSLELGTGETTIEKLNVVDNCKIESGAGKVDIYSGKINNLNLDIGVGKFKLTSSIIGNSKINAGIGNLELNIQGNKEDYKIKADKGIGTIKIDGKNVEDNYEYGDGENEVKIEGGIGSISVDFKEE